MKKISFLAMMLVVVLMAGFLVGCGMLKQVNETPQQRIERITGMKLPENAELEYNYTGKTFTGRASQYAVFSFQTEPTEFLTKYSFFGGDNEFNTQNYIPAQYDGKSFIDWLERNNIPSEHHPNIELEFYWYGGSLFSKSLNMIYLPSELRLMIILVGY